MGFDAACSASRPFQGLQQASMISLVPLKRGG